MRMREVEIQCFKHRLWRRIQQTTQERSKVTSAQSVQQHQTELIKTPTTRRRLSHITTTDASGSLVCDTGKGSVVKVERKGFPSPFVIGCSRGDSMADRRKDELNGYVWHLVHTAPEVAQGNGQKDKAWYLIAVVLGVEDGMSVSSLSDVCFSEGHMSSSNDLPLDPHDVPDLMKLHRRRQEQEVPGLLGWSGPTGCRCVCRSV
ncbi:unnamed protein product [Boreogadus saida]